MTFTLVFSNGSIDSEFSTLEDSAGLQFSDSIVNLFPHCDLLLLTDVNQQVFYSLSSEFTTNATVFGTVCTKQTLSHWVIQTPTLCRFNVNAYTVTFGKYNSLYSLEGDMPLLQSVPFSRQHFFCLVLKRCSNWRSMLYHCCSVLQIQFPQYQKKQCHLNKYIVLMGWQRPVSLLCSQPLFIYPPLQLTRPLKMHGSCNKLMRTYNRYPVYVYISCPAPPCSLKAKCPRLFHCSDAVLPRPIPIVPQEEYNPFEFEVQPVVEESKGHIAVESTKQNEDTIEDWVLTAVCIED